MGKYIICVLLIAAICMQGCKKKDEPTNTNKSIYARTITPTPPAMGPCNGSPAYCSKRYDQVIYVTTHNSYNYRVGPHPFNIPNQTYAVDRQLQDGVRAFMSDVYYDTDSTVIQYHGSPAFGKEPLLTSLQYIKTFLDAHPTDIVTIIFECYVSGPAIEHDMQSAGLTGYLHAQSASQPWPMLSQMITDNNRLVVFSDKRDDNIAWYHYCWDYAVETAFTNSDTTDFSCNYNRGNAANSLFILNHFLTTPGIGTGDSARARIANTNPYFIKRALNCTNATGKLPNFLTVDFYDIGDVFAVADSLNRLH